MVSPPVRRMLAAPPASVSSEVFEIQLAPPFTEKKDPLRSSTMTILRKSACQVDSCPSDPVVAGLHAAMAPPVAASKAI
jgi:hypothetical protein